VSPLKKIIERFTGNGTTEHPPLQLRAFGKLPISNEYINVDVGQGPAKDFLEWYHEGHANWIRLSGPDKRGEIVPTCLYWPVPGSKNQAVVACTWNSQDGASPPRSFPFTLLVLVQNPPKRSWADHFSVCNHLWTQMQSYFQPLYDEETPLQQIREVTLSVSFDELESTNESLSNQVESINLSSWLDSIAVSTACPDAANLMGLFHWLISSRREHLTKHGLGVRLPLSPEFPIPPQVVAWLQWLHSHLGETSPPLTSLLVPIDATSPSPAVTILTRPVTSNDLQLATSKACDFPGVEDLVQAARNLPPASHVDIPSEQNEILQDRNKTLWDWANAG